MRKRKTTYLLLGIYGILALIVLFSAALLLKSPPRQVFVQESFVVSNFSSFNISNHVNESLTFTGTVIGQHLFYRTLDMAGPFYEFQDPAGAGLYLVAAPNETFEFGLSYIVLARVVADERSYCGENVTQCPIDHYLLALMRNR